MTRLLYREAINAMLKTPASVTIDEHRDALRFVIAWLEDPADKDQPDKAEAAQHLRQAYACLERWWA